MANNLEVAIMAAASLIHNYTQAGYQVQLATNLVSKVHGLSQRPTGLLRGRAQRSQLLSNLSLLQNFSVEPGEQVLKAQTRIRPGATIVVVSTAPDELTPEFSQALRKLMRRSRVALVRVQPNITSLPRESGLKEWRVEGGTDWHELEKLELF